MVSVALDVNPEFARPFITAASPTHPSLFDTTHVTGERFGFQNVPMAVWIDEDGMLVRPAEFAAIERSPFRGRDIPDGLPDRLRRTLETVKEFPDNSDDYRAAIEDWVTHGSSSRFALSPDEVIERSQPRPPAHAEAAACFEIGQHLWRTIGNEAAVPWWRRAHALFPENFTYKRNAWTFVTTPEGAEAPDLLQGPNEVYDGNWLDDVTAIGGANYYPSPDL